MKGLWRRPVSETSLTASNLGTPGEWRYETDGKIYQLVQCNVALSAGMAYQFESVTTGSSGYIVGLNHNTLWKADGVYNAQTVSVASNAYFWGQRYGTGAVLVGGGTVASNLVLIASTAGVVTVAATDVGARAFRTIASATNGVVATMHINCL